MKKHEEVERLKNDANKSKEHLIEIMHELFSIGAKKEAEQLEKIIVKLEVWQNR